MPHTPAPSSTDISLHPSVTSLTPPPPPLSKPSLPELKTSSSSPTTSRSRITRSAGKEKERERGVMDTKRYNSGDSSKRNNHTNDASSVTNGAIDKTNKTETKIKETSAVAVSTDRTVARGHTGQVWEAELKPLLDRLDPQATSGAVLIDACTEVWRLLEMHSLLGKGLGGKRRSTLLKSLFALLGHQEPKLLLILAKIILAVRSESLGEREGGRERMKECTLILCILHNCD